MAQHLTPARYRPRTQYIAYDEHAYSLRPVARCSPYINSYQRFAKTIENMTFIGGESRFPE